MAREQLCMPAHAGLSSLDADAAPLYLHSEPVAACLFDSLDVGLSQRSHLSATSAARRSESHLDTNEGYGKQPQITSAPIYNVA